MPPKATKAVAPRPSAVRQSPRKRKHDESTKLDEIPQPSRHKLEASDIKAEEQNNDTRKKRVKKDIVVDEPSRSDIAATEEAPETTGIKARSGPNNKAKGPTKPSAPKESIESESDSPIEEDSEAQKKPRQRKTKEQKEAENMPLAIRSTGVNMFVGAHVSIAKGVENAITNAVHIGGNALAMFLQSQRKWENPELKSENKNAFIKACSHHNYQANQHIVPHGSYLVNLAAKDAAQAKKSYDFFLNDLKRCEALGIRYYNFHPGATGKEPLHEAIGRLAKQLNKALSETSTVVPILENMAGTETIIGSRFTDLAQVIAEIKPEYLGRIGICIDTCHAFAAGYDLRTPEAFQKTFKELDDVVGLKYLKAMHINDSKGMFKSKKDLHQNIGLGFLGLRAFHNVMNEPRLTNIPLILETPSEKPDPKDPKKTVEDKTVWAREIKLLESLIGMDPDSEAYKKLESDLAEQGRAERDKMEKWQAEKEEKERVKTEKIHKKAEQGQKSIKGMLGGKASGGKKKSKATKGSDSELSDLSDS